MAVRLPKKWFFKLCWKNMPMQCNAMSCNPKVHYRIQSSSPLEDTLAKSKSVHSFTHSSSKRRSLCLPLVGKVSAKFCG
jgi:hypothetical protein